MMLMLFFCPMTCQYFSGTDREAERANGNNGNNVSQDKKANGNNGNNGPMEIHIYVFTAKGTLFVLACLVLSCLVLSCLVLACLGLSRLGLNALTCLVFSSLVLSCLG